MFKLRERRRKADERRKKTEKEDELSERSFPFFQSLQK